MFSIENIREKIGNKEAAKFQDFGNLYFSIIEHREIYPLGNNIKGNRTTKGTPDAFSSDGKTYVEYTLVRGEIIAKLKKDLEKVKSYIIDNKLEDKVEEVVLVYISNRVDPANKIYLEKYLKEYNIRVRLLSINDMADKIFKERCLPLLEYLDIRIPISIHTCSEYIEEESNKRLGIVVYEGREKYIEDICCALDNKKIVLISGQAGIGKTRLAIECTKLYTVEDYKKCILECNNVESLSEIENFFWDTKGYILILDDINKISDIRYVISKMAKFVENKDFRVIITVRDYLREDIKIILDRDYSDSYVNCHLDPLSTENVSNILGDAAYELESNIMKVIAGNPRIAIILKSIVYGNNQEIGAIKDRYDIFGLYYKEILDDLKEINENSFIILGIIAFLNEVDQERLKLFFENMTKISHVDIDSVVDKLIDKNLIKQYKFLDRSYPRLLKISDECLANYLIAKFAKEKEIGELLVFLMDTNLKILYENIKIVEMLFYKNAYEIIANIVKVINEKLDKSSEVEKITIFSELGEFVCRRALKYINDMLIVAKSDNSPMSINEKNTRDLRLINDPIVAIAYSIIGKVDSRKILTILFKYLEKNTNLRGTLNYIIEFHFLPKNDYHSDFINTIKMLELMKEKISDDINVVESIIFIDNLDLLLKIEYPPGEDFLYGAIFDNERKLSKNYVLYRVLMWEIIDILIRKDFYKEKISEIIKGYIVSIDYSDTPKEVMLFDYNYIRGVLKDFIISDSIEDTCILAKYSLLFDRFNPLEYKNLSDISKRTDYLFIKKIISGMNKNNNYSTLRNLLSVNDIEDNAKKIVSIICELRNKTDRFYEIFPEYNISSSLINMFDYLYEKDYSLYLNIIDSFLKNDKYNIIPNKNIICEKIKKNSGTDFLFELVNKVNNSNFAYTFFTSLDKSEINPYYVEKWVEFVSSGKFELNNIRCGLNLYFLEEFYSIDSKIYVKTAEIILKKKDIVGMYKLVFGVLFMEYTDNPIQLLNRLGNEKALLFEIYKNLLIEETYIDSKAEYLILLYEDYSKLIMDVVYKQLGPHPHCLGMWDNTKIIKSDIGSKFYDDFFNNIEDVVMKGIYCTDILMHIGLMDINEKNKTEILEWCKGFVRENSKNVNRMVAIFKSIIKWPIEEYKEILIEYMKCDPDEEEFYKVIDVEKAVYWDDVEYYEGRIKLYEKIKKFVEEYIPEYKELIDGKILLLNKEIDSIIFDNRW